MPNYHVQFFFESYQQSLTHASASPGWTEGWWMQADLGFDGVRNSPDVTSYIELRMACMPELYRLAWLRVSNADLPRSFKIYNIGNQFGRLPASRASQVNCCILVDFERTPASLLDNAHHRRYLFRGLTTQMIDGNIINVGPDYNKFKTFLDFIGGRDVNAVRDNTKAHATALGLRYQSLVNSPVPITLLEPSGSNTKRIKVEPPAAGNVLGTKIEIRGVQDLPAVNKVWRLVTLFDTYMNLGQLRKGIPANYAYTVTQGATYKVLNYLYGLAEQYTVIGLRNKKTGSVFRRLRGRR